MSVVSSHRSTQCHADWLQTQRSRSHSSERVYYNVAVHQRSLQTIRAMWTLQLKYCTRVENNFIDRVVGQRTAVGHVFVHFHSS